MSLTPEQMAGRVAFCISVKIDAKEMATWSTDRIQIFFAGVAKTVQAKAEINQPPKQFPLAMGVQP